MVARGCRVPLPKVSTHLLPRVGLCAVGQGSSQTCSWKLCLLPPTRKRNCITRESTTQRKGNSRWMLWRYAVGKTSENLSVDFGVRSSWKLIRVLYSVSQVYVNTPLQENPTRKSMINIIIYVICEEINVNRNQQILFLQERAWAPLQ